jgi:hypothetical protein
MSQNAIITRFFTVEATPEGVEIPILGRDVPMINTGYIEQIIARPVVGGGSTIDIEIRYQQGVDDEETLVYQCLDEPYPAIDSRIRGPFSLLNRQGETGVDIYLFVRPAASGIINVRVDIEMLKFVG